MLSTSRSRSDVPTAVKPNDTLVQTINAGGLVSMKTEAGHYFGPPEHSGEVGTLGRYRVLKQLGRGGMGAVYLAFDRGLQRKVALKVMLPNFACDVDSRDRFLREARAAAQVKCDHVVTIFDVGEERGIAFIAMEYLQGYPLDEYFRKKGNVSLHHAVRIARETAIGLSAAHDLGLVHRDIKPANLWLEVPKGRVKILDFGLARRENDYEHLTQDGEVVGTPAFMSPEQARGFIVDARSDLFSLGAVLYRLCTGQLPFDGQSTMALLTALAVDRHSPVRKLNPQVSEPLAKIVDRLLAKEASDRFQNAAEVAEALRRIAEPQRTQGPMIVKVEPMAIDAQVESVWADLDETLVEESSSRRIASPSTNGARRKHSWRKWVVAGVAALLVMAALAVITIQTPRGTLVIDCDDPDVEVVVKKDGAIVRDKVKDREIELKVGNYTIELSEKKDGLKLNTDRFEITKNGKATVRIWLEKPPIAKAKNNAPPKEPDRRGAEWALSIGGTIGLVNQERQVKIAADLPKGAFQLSYVSLFSIKQVGDAGLANFKECKSLAVLNLDHTGVSSSGLAHLKDCTGLVELYLVGTQVGDSGLAHLKDCKSLTHIRLEGTGVGDAGVAHLKDHNNLVMLGLSNTQVTDAGLRNFKDCKNLKEIGLENTDVGDVGLANFKGFKFLGRVSLANSKVTDAGLDAFSDAKLMTELDLRGVNLTDEGLTKIAGLKSLTNLSLSGTQVTAAGIGELKKALPQCKIHWDGGLVEPKK